VDRSSLELELKVEAPAHVLELYVKGCIRMAHWALLGGLGLHRRCLPAGLLLLQAHYFASLRRR